MYNVFKLVLRDVLEPTCYAFHTIKTQFLVNVRLKIVQILLEDILSTRKLSPFLEEEIQL
jgi:hypothetical protein